MTTIDIIILAIITLSTLYGIWKGFTRISLNLCLWIVVSIAVAHFRAPVTIWLKLFIASPILAQIISSTIILLGVIIVGGCLSAWIVRIVHLTPMRGVDHLLGGLLGGVCGILSIITIFFVISFLPNTTLQKIETNSKFTPYIQLEVHQLKLLAPSLNFNKISHNLLNSLSNLNHLN